MTQPINPKTLLITGGSQGIGQATVIHFLTQGWRVLFTARKTSGIQALEAELASRGFGPERVRGLELDASDLEASQNIAANCDWLQDGLDALVLNAFYQKIQPAQDFDAETLNRHWTINNLSPILMMNALTPSLKQAQGSVVYVSSIMDQRRNPGYAAYGASKAYMKCFFQQAAHDFGPLGIRLNVVSPGATMTEAMEAAIEAEGPDGQAIYEDMLTKIPMEQRCASPGEIAETIWFAVTGPRYLHGADLRVDGGMY